MSVLNQIKAPVAAELAQFDRFLREALKSDNQLVDTMLNYVISNRGKGIRPLLALLSAALHAGGKALGERSYLAAMLLEMIHTASLVHDDVIDEASFRRGKPSVNAIWHSHRSVLLGDYILARSYTVGMESGHYDIVAYITHTMGEICEGELIQSDQSDRLEMTREIYFDIIYKKTATLLGTSSGVGALSVGAPMDRIAAMKQFGDNLGMAFQIKDDILDYNLTANTGKPACADLRERKITLPLLTVLERSSEQERSEILRLLSDIRDTPTNADILCDLVTSQGGLEIASEVMEEYTQKALRIVGSYPESPYRTALEQLCDSLAAREQ